ncbi:MAG: hypothetical protein AVDCRST_MAG03-1432, partial [uncultured Rubrobacteraceae bacterium]
AEPRLLPAGVLLSSGSRDGRDPVQGVEGVPRNVEDGRRSGLRRVYGRSRAALRVVAVGSLRRGRYEPRARGRPGRLLYRSRRAPPAVHQPSGVQVQVSVLLGTHPGSRGVRRDRPCAVSL